MRCKNAALTHRNLNYIHMQFLTDALEDYIQTFSTPEDEVLYRLRRETHLKIPMPQMVSGPLQGQFLTFITQMVQPKTVLEIGMFTGYSAICFAKAMRKDSVLHTIDINEELEAFAAKYFMEASVQHIIRQHIGDARSIIAEIPDTFDIVFIDADKQNYSLYYDLVFDKVRPGGYIIADNVLWSGKVVNEVKDKDTAAIHAYNEKVRNDNRVTNFILPLRDGLNIAHKTV